MSKQSLLLVDGDTRSLRVLEVSLRKAGFSVTPAESVQDALDKLELHAPDLIISETTFPDGDGFDLRRRVRATPDWGEIPFIFLTAETAIENKIKGLELGVDDYLTKPIYIKEIVTRINILLQKRQRVRFEERKDGRTRFAGRVNDMPVVDVIQTIEISRKSGVIQFVGERGRQAAIYFRDGRVIDAEAGTLQGEDAVYRLLTWSDGEFEVVFRTVRRREVITTSSQGLLMEGMRRLDEWSRLLEQLPPLTHRFEIDAGELAARLGDVPDDNNRILRSIDGKRTLLEVIDASDFRDLECLQAVARLYFEGMLIDLDHDAPRRRDTGKPMPLVELDAPTPIEEVVSGPIPLGPMDTARVSDASILSEESAPATHRSTEAPPHGALLGGYRPSGLILIDAAVAAAEAIEPGLFDDEPRGRAPMRAAVADQSVPEASEADEASPPRRARPSPVAAPPDLPSLSRRHDEPGLRMIGSLGRDRAEASGELRPAGESSSSFQVPETQRELVTILPRRITREMQAVQPLSEVRATTPATPVEAGTSRVLTPRPTPRPMAVAPSGSGVARPDTGPGAGAIALILFAALLAGVAVFVWLRKSNQQHEVAVGSDAGRDARMLVGSATDAAVGDPIDADVPPLATDAARPAVAVDAAVPIDADTGRPGVIDAGASTTVVDAGVDPVQQAKILMQQAQNANQEGDFAKALALASSSLKLRRTARAYIVRAQALQRLARIEDALASLDSAEELAPDYASVFEARGSILWAAGETRRARAAYERFLELEPSSARGTQIRKRLAEPK